MLYRLERHALWVIWILMTSCAFSIFPVGPYGLLGWLGATAPLLQLVLTGLTRRRLFILGFSGMLLAMLLDGGMNWIESLAVIAVFTFGVLLTPPRSRLHRANESHSASNETRLCEHALSRELGRARRYNRSVSVLSVACEDSGADLTALLKALSGQLHLYCQVFLFDRRIIAIVPELDASDWISMQSRIFQAIRIRVPGAVTLGHSSFPADALTCAALIEAADANRRPFTQAEPTNNATPPTACEQSGGLRSELPWH